MKKIGIITFHSAYNYGSVLQAFATQECVKKLGFQPEILNYRLAEQKKVYSNLRISYGVKDLIRDITLLPMLRERNQKYASFEKFFREKLILSKEFSEPKEAKEIWKQYPAVISGSDQIWNKHAIELEHAAWKYMKPYLLEGYNGKKISYASSTASMTQEELERIKPFLLKFSHIAMREPSSSEKIGALLGKQVESVLDPTFLLNKNDWINALQLQKKPNRHIVYYSLGGLKRFHAIKPVLEEISKREGCKIRLFMPFCYTVPNKMFEPHPECGPIEFLQNIYQAKKVITDSYHGTILSVNFGKDVYSVCKNGGSEFRKTDILKMLGMKDRIITRPEQLVRKQFAPIDYQAVDAKLHELRTHSISYLASALEE